MDNRGYRQCVRVIIQKEDKILLCNKFINKKFVGYVFPGGGIEGYSTVNETVIQECLEEVGILVNHVRPLGVDFHYDAKFSKPERAYLYRGNNDNWQLCDYVREDERQFNTEGDGMSYQWVTPEKAVSLIAKDQSDKVYVPMRMQALRRLIELRKELLRTLIIQGW